MTLCRNFAVDFGGICYTTCYVASFPANPQPVGVKWKVTKGSRKLWRVKVGSSGREKVRIRRVNRFSSTVWQDLSSTC